ADAVQAAGDLVAVVVELTAGVQLSHDDLRRRHALFLVDVDRDAAAIVGHRHRAVLVDGHGDVVGVPGQGLVDGVVDHLDHHVVQAGAVVYAADVHAWTLAHGLQAAQHGDPAGIVDVALALLGAKVGFGHSARDSHGDGGRRRDSLAMDASIIAISGPDRCPAPRDERFRPGLPGRVPRGTRRVHGRAGRLRRAVRCR